MTTTRSLTACQHLTVKSRSKNVPLEYDRGKIFFRQSGEEIQENEKRSNKNEGVIMEKIFPCNYKHKSHKGLPLVFKSPSLDQPT